MAIVVPSGKGIAPVDNDEYSICSASEITVRISNARAASRVVRKRKACRRLSSKKKFKDAD
jgi:hypothetical protein